MDSLNHDNQADVIEAFNSTLLRLLGTSIGVFNIDNLYFEGTGKQIYPPDKISSLNKANNKDTETPF